MINWKFNFNTLILTGLWLLCLSYNHFQGSTVSILIKFSVSLSVWLSVCHGICLCVCQFHSGNFIFWVFSIFFHLVEQVLRIMVVKTEFKYLQWFLRKSKITTKCNVKMHHNRQFLGSQAFIFKDIFKNFSLSVRVGS